MYDETMQPAASDVAAILSSVRTRVRALVQGLDDAQLGQPVALTPHLSIRDVIAHLAAAASGRVPAPGLPFTPLALDGAADGRSMVELLDAWDHGHLSLVGADNKAVLVALLVDAVIREHDLRTTLDRPGFRDDESVVVALNVLADGLSERVAKAGLPALRVTVEQWGTVAGEGPGVRCLVADRFEFVRGMTGRRSISQVRRWNWDRSPGAYLDVLSFTGRLPEDDIRERDPRVPARMRDFDLTH